MYIEERGALALMGERPRATCVLPQPSFKHFSLKSPLATDFKRWKLLLSHQSIDSESVHVEVFGDLLRCKQLFWHLVTHLEFYCTKGKRLLKSVDVAIIGSCLNRIKLISISGSGFFSSWELGGTYPQPMQ